MDLFRRTRIYTKRVRFIVFLSDLKCGMDVRLAFVLCVLAGAVSAESASGKSRSCAAFRQFYSSKGFGMSGVPQAQISGECVRKLCNSLLQV